MDNITFMQFIRAYNFKEICIDGKSDDTSIIRIFYPAEEFTTTNWFEFGVYDFSNKKSLEEKMPKILSKEIIESYVDWIRHDVENGILMISLSKEKEYDY